MARVEPIRSMVDIDKFKQVLLKKNKRDYIMALIGFNTGLRIGDILSFNVEDVYDKNFINLYEQKTNKYKRFPIKGIKDEIREYIDEAGLREGDPLIPSRETDENGYLKNITTRQAYNVLKEAADEIGIDYFGTHSLRKSFGYHYYKKTKDVAQLMTIFNHSSQSVTLLYIGVTHEEIEESLEDFYL